MWVDRGLRREGEIKSIKGNLAYNSILIKEVGHSSLFFGHEGEISGIHLHIIMLDNFFII